MVQFTPAVQAGQPLVQAGGAPPAAFLMQQPNLLCRMLASLGRRLVDLGNPRLVMNTATPLTVQMPMAVALQSPSVATPQQVASTPMVQSAPPAVTASPQSGHHFGWGLFHHND
jgi:hypothetical protein